MPPPTSAPIFNGLPFGRMGFMYDLIPADGPEPPACGVLPVRIEEPAERFELRGGVFGAPGDKGFRFCSARRQPVAEEHEGIARCVGGFDGEPNALALSRTDTHASINFPDT